MDISVVIPTHNRSDIIARAIKSVQQQTYPVKEIIIVSDGGTDNTDEVVAAMQKEDARIQFHTYTPNRGGNYARNTGIKKATGDFVAFLDDDDEWYPEKIEHQTTIVSQSSEIGLVYTGVKHLYEKENISYTSTPSHVGDLSKDILFKNLIGTTSTVMVKKSLLDQVKGFDENLPALQDYDLWIRLCQLTKVGSVTVPMINYYNELGSKQISSNTKKYEDAFAQMEQKYADVYATLTKEERESVHINQYKLLANKAMRNNNKKLARNYMKKALQLNVSLNAIVYYMTSFFSYKTVLKMRSKK